VFGVGSELADGDGQDKRLFFTMSTFTLPSFAAPSSSSATSCAASLTYVLHVSPKSKRGGTSVLACVKRAAHGQRRGDMRVLGVFENWAEKCVCLI